MLLFRFARPEDLPRIVAIYNQTVPGRMVTADLFPVSVAQRLPWFRAHNARHPLVSVFCDGVLCGWYSFQPYHPRAAYAATAELSIYLDESFRGRGLGTRMMAHALSLAGSIGLENIIGLIFGHNAPSLALFAKFGFTQWGLLPGIARLDGVPRDLALWGRHLPTQPLL